MGRAGYHSSHPETRPAGRHGWRCKIVPDDFVEPAAGSHPARIGNSKKAPLGRLSTLVGRAGYHSSHPETRPAGRHRWRCKIVPDDFVEPAAGSHPARIGNSKKAPLGRLSTLVGRAGYHSSHPETRPAGRHRWRCKIAPGDFVEPAAGSHPARLSHGAQKRKKRQKALFSKYGGSCRIRTCDQLIKSQLLYQLS